MRWWIIAVVLVVLVLATRKVIVMLKSPVYKTYKDPIDAAAAEFAIPTYRITAIVTHESSGNSSVPDSSTGAVGVMQIKPGALQDVNNILGFHFSPDDRRDPAKCIRIGTAYLYLQLQHFKDLDLATQAFNQGPGTVEADPTSGLDYLQAVKKIENQILFT